MNSGGNDNEDSNPDPSRALPSGNLTRLLAGQNASGPAHPRSLKRWILPVAVFGSSGTNSSQRGYL